MSSTTGLNRTRSVRKPAVNENEATPQRLVQGRSEARNVSPSRLPMRPPTTRSTTSSTTASSSTATTRTRPPTGSTSRQVSGSSSSRTSSRATEREAPAAARPLGRAPSVRQAPSTTTTTTTTASSNGIGRSASIARPRSSAGLPSAKGTREGTRERPLGHSRAKSTVTSLTAATTLRPLSHAPPRSNPSPAPSTASSTSTATTSTRAQTRSQTQHARVPSQAKPLSSATTTSTLAARRPAFSTNQQHYSPAKSLAPKPLTSTFLAPPSPSKQPVNVAITAETSRLQTELLQLSLLHREAPAVLASWHASARSKLGTRFQELVAADEALQAIEREGAEERGLEDLIRWGNAAPEPSPDGNAGRSIKNETKGERGIHRRRNSERNKIPLDEKIRLLDQILNGAWALGEPGGRYQRTVRAFEDWAVHVSEIRAAHRGGDIDGLLARSSGRGEELGIFVSDLDAGPWKRDHAGLVRMLEGWRRTLAQLGHVDDEESADGVEVPNGAGAKKNDKPLSGLARTLRGCRSLVCDMLAELKLMEQVELDALVAEEEWMARMEEQLGAEDEVDASGRRRKEDVPPWKLLVS
ncbi:hypothetical protein F5Y03DRAFT_207560 [Xylaria venustula]|nr:hypothetical protein F5Y03DRAFT_207560 [Xylaria venustula]